MHHPAGHALDLVIAPDLSSHHWKDSDEYRQLRCLGVVDDYLARQAERARGWPAWKPDPAWPLPVLPEDAAVASPARGRPYGR